MDSTQNALPAPDTSVAMLRGLQLVDLLGQIACFWLSTYFSYASGPAAEGPVAQFFLDRDLGLLFTLGTWQVVSALVHLLFWKRLPHPKKGRRIYLFILAGLGLLLGAMLVTNSQVEDEGLLILFGLLFLSPIWAAFYFCVTALELWALSAQAQTTADSGTVAAGSVLQVVPQGLLLLVGLIPYYLFAALAGSSTGVLYVWVIYLALLALAGWLFVGYLNARHLGQAAPIESFCAVWVSVTIFVSVAEMVFTNDLPLPWSWVRPLLSPTVALPVWFAATLWRGPIRLQSVAVNEQ
ncbi:MAG: hypothetical protein EOP52_02640 [Sphingobacteriales bacterium]|nr:MAG: hypothetical protein EOP52_02640 [Sphingobacteriales bacterium]